MIYFYLPNFFTFQYKVLNLEFIKLLQEFPHYFYDNIAIGAVYGSFPGVIWNGGRSVVGDCTINQVCEILNDFDELKVPLRFTYTNTLIDNQMLLDPQSNIVTSLAATGNNEIIVNSILLETYLRKNYPNYKYISSTTKCLIDNEKIKEESNYYYLTVLDYRKNTEIEFLKQLNNPEKYELLINSYCDPKCKRREEHYMIISENQLKFQMDNFPCKLRINNFFESLNFPTVIKNTDLYNIYVPMGFKHFKIEGRTNNLIDLLESYLYYMVKPEYKDIVRYSLLKKII